MKHFQFSLKTQVRFGAGCRAQLAEVLTQMQWSPVGVVVDHNLMAVPVIREFLDQLQAKFAAKIVACTIMEPDYDSLDKVRREFEGSPVKAFIGIGGGSALDMAKAMAVLVLNREPAITYRGFDKMTFPVLPILAVPTTAGTGSEVTPNASFIDSAGKKKLGINGEAVRPLYAFLDPELTLSCPLKPTLSAAVDSLVHATEAYVAKKSNPMAQFFAREGFSRVFKYLPQVLKHLDDTQARAEVMYGAFLSGVALMHSGTGPAAALSYPLGVHYKVPHGVGGAIFLPHVVQYNMDQGVTAYAGLYEGLNPGSDLNEAQKSEQFAKDMFATWAEINVPQDLPKIHPDISVDVMVRDTLELKGALEQNPIEFGEPQLRAVLKKLGVG